MFADIKYDLNSIKKELTYTNNEIIKTSQRLEQLQQKFEDFDSQLNEDIKNLKSEIYNKYAEFNNLKANLQILTNELTQFESITEKYNNLLENINKLQKEKQMVNQEIVKLECGIKSIEDFIDEISKLKEGLCEVCTQLFNSRYDYDNRINKINKLKTKLIEREQVKNNLEIELNDFNAELTFYKTELTNLQEKKIQKEKLSFTVQSLSAEIKKLKKDYDKLLNDKSNPFNELIDKTNIELNTLKTQLCNYEKDSKHLEILKEACSENGVKRFIIKDIVKLLNSLIQKYLNEIGAEYLVYFDESFEFKFITMNGECEFSNFSTGERQRIQIATILAFRDLILNGKINSNIFVIDEFLDSGIDSIAIKNILNILSRKSLEYNQNIFIISHRQETTESAIFNHIIEVVKENRYVDCKNFMNFINIIYIYKLE